MIWCTKSSVHSAACLLLHTKFVNFWQLGVCFYGFLQWHWNILRTFGVSSAISFIFLLISECSNCNLCLCEMFCRITKSEEFCLLCLQGLVGCWLAGKSCWLFHKTRIYMCIMLVLKLQGLVHTAPGLFRKCEFQKRQKKEKEKRDHKWRVLGKPKWKWGSSFLSPYYRQWGAWIFFCNLPPA